MERKGLVLISLVSICISLTGGQLVSSYVANDLNSVCCSTLISPISIRTRINSTHYECQCVFDGLVNIIGAKSRHFSAIQYLISFLIVFALLLASGFCSGLNVGLMSLDVTDLNIIAETSDSKKERRYAEKVLKIRKEGNVVLVAILLGNVCVNSILSLFLDSLVGSGTIAVAISTLTIVVFGEILPQAVCLRHALYFGNLFRYLTRFLIILTSPLSYPLGLFLNYFIGDPSSKSSITTRSGLFLVMQKLSENIITEKEMKIMQDVIQNKPITLGEKALPIKQLNTVPLSSYSEKSLDKATGNMILLTDGPDNSVVGYVNVKDAVRKDFDIDKYLYISKFPYFNASTSILDALSTINFQKDADSIIFVQSMNLKSSRAITIGYITRERLIEEFLKNWKN
ncbi:metal transporter CNNM4 [Lepeophtheirus salmonis]|uniref:metal transporter CNNM4 n=1 Tax=Lepeophtheirus salmonis TaxID=72036 RepID=UPI001AEA4BFB|nr:metal transporter CNNM4-like [Lepeophtheirus salmonis]